MRALDKRRTQPLAALALTLLAAVACERFDPEPREVAAAFWTALEARDLEAALAVSDADERSALRELADGLTLEGVTLAAILRNEDTALVETHGALARRDLDLTFHTHLVRAGEGWRVDVDATERDLRRTALAVSFEEVRESIGESTQLLVEEFEKQALEVSEALRESLKDLEDSLREDPPPSS